jgi:hypothetical protein
MISQNLFLLLLAFSLHYDSFFVFLIFCLCVVWNVASRDGHYWVLRSMRKFSRVRGLGFILKGFFSARCRKLSNCTVEIKEVEFKRFVLCFSNSQCQLHPRGVCSQRIGFKIFCQVL